MILYDFHCHSCNSVFEKLADSKNFETLCECGAISKRIISTPTIKLDGTSGDFPTAHDHWANIREQNARIKAKKEG